MDSPNHKECTLLRPVSATASDHSQPLRGSEDMARERELAELEERMEDLRLKYDIFPLGSEL